MATIGNDIEYAAQLLRKSELVAVPTETVYGLAGNALDENAVLKIFKAKQRPSFDPLIVHTSTIDRIEKFVHDIPEKAQRLARHFWPGPMTILLKKKNLISDLVTSGLDTVAVRIPNHPLALSLLDSLDFPLAAPSANPFGYISPTTALHVEEQLGNKIEYILDGGPCSVGVESTIVSFENQVPTVLRLGGQPIEKIETVIGKVEVNEHSSSTPQAPGMLKSHYAPSKGFSLEEVSNTLRSTPASAIGALVFGSYLNELPRENQVNLSEEGSLEEAAKNLFGALRKLDQKTDIRVIIGSLLPDQGLGRAINDRLKRAAAK